MKKLNTILITSVLFLGAFGVQANLTSDTKSVGVGAGKIASDIANGVKDHWIGGYRGNSHHLTKYGKQEQAWRKGFFLKKKLKKAERKLADTRDYLDHMEYLWGVDKEKVKKARKKVDHLEIISASENELTLASNLLYANIYHFDRTEKERDKTKKKYDKLFRTIQKYKASIDGWNRRFKKLQAKDGVLGHAPTK